VAHYRLDETAGGKLSDSSGNGLDMTVGGIPVLGAPGAAAGTGTSIDFDGAGDHAWVVDGPPLTGMRSELSVSAWVNPDQLVGFHRIFGNESSWEFGFYYDQLLFTTRGIQDYMGGGSITPGTWTHVACVFDASFDVTFYVDGQPISTVVGASQSGPSGTRWFIATLQGATEWFDGHLDDIQVYDGALTAAEVSYLYQNPGATVQCGGVIYCTAKLNSQGCVPAVAHLGAPSVSNAGPFDIRAANLVNNKTGMFFYGLSGRLNLTFQGGVLCVLPPLRRTAVQNTGGNPPPADCSGTLAIDFNQWMQKGHGANLLPVGAQAWGQFWYLDPLDPVGVGLSDAIEFTVGP